MWCRIGIVAFSLAVSSALARSAVPSAQRQAELESLLLQDCGSCHGLMLKGGLGPALRPQVLAGKPRQWLIDTIRNGRPGTAMPPWGPILSDADIAWLVDRLLRGAPDTGVRP